MTVTTSTWNNPVSLDKAVGATLPATDLNKLLSDLAYLAGTDGVSGYAGPRANLLVNPGFEIWQRGTGAYTTNNAHTADRWQIGLNGTSTMSVSQTTATVDTGSEAAAAITYTHNTESSLYQRMGTDSIKRLAGRTVTVSLRVKTATASAARTSLVDSTGGLSSYGSFHTGDGTWQTLTVTGAVPAAAAWMDVRVALDASATIYVDNATLVIGSVAADYSPLHPADDLARCLRYYERPIDHADAAFSTPGFYANAGSVAVGLHLFYRAPKPATPTVTVNGTWAVTNVAGQPSVDTGSKTGCRFVGTSSGAGMVSWATNSSEDNVTVEVNP